MCTYILQKNKHGSHLDFCWLYFKPVWHIVLCNIYIIIILGGWAQLLNITGAWVVQVWYFLDTSSPSMPQLVANHEVDYGISQQGHPKAYEETDY